MVRNLLGPPVTGDDFFDRESDLRRLWERLAGHNVLLLAPRRVGKTSLMFKLRQEAEAHGFEAAYLSVADVGSEFAFVKKLYSAVNDLAAADSVFKKLANGRFGQFFRRIKTVKLGKFVIEFSDAAEKEWHLLGKEIASVLDSDDRRWLLLIDELPVYVLSLLRQDPTGRRAGGFLNWFRALRQETDAQGHLRWLLAGSIGLDTVTSRLNLGATINDLDLRPLGPFAPETADRLLGQLARTYRLSVSPEVRQEILRRIGWPIPFYLQLVFSELREHCEDLGHREPTTDTVAEVIESLLSPAKKGYFDYWRQRLELELGRPDSVPAIALLNAAAADEKGATQATLGQILARQIRDPQERQQKLRYLLDVLQSDGYLVSKTGRYAFRSPLLREYWLRRVVP